MHLVDKGRERLGNDFDFYDFLRKYSQLWETREKGNVRFNSARQKHHVFLENEKKMIRNDSSDQFDTSIVIFEIHNVLNRSFDQFSFFIFERNRSHISVASDVRLDHTRQWPEMRFCVFFFEKH